MLRAMMQASSRLSRASSQALSTGSQNVIFSRQDNESFLRYQENRNRLLTEQPHLLRLDCMNPFKALSHLILPDDSSSSSSSSSSPPLSSPSSFASLSPSFSQVYTSWSQASGVTIPKSNRVVCLGVRDLLSSLFGHLASLQEQGQRLFVAVPQDVYPVYHQLLRHHGLTPGLSFTTIRFILNKTLAQIDQLTTPSSAAPENSFDKVVLLLPSPLSPMGRHLKAEEVADLSTWIAGDKRRTVVLDAVYHLRLGSEPRLPSESVGPCCDDSLLASEQVIKVYSLSKGWLAPLTFGVAHVPSSWQPNLQSRSTQPSAAELSLALQRLQRQPRLPRLIAQRLAQQWRVLAPLLLARFQCSWSPPLDGYFSIFPIPYQTMLQHGFLSIPPSLFGSHREDVSLISCLHDIAPCDLHDPKLHPLISSSLSSSSTSSSSSSFFPSTTSSASSSPSSCSSSSTSPSPASSSSSSTFTYYHIIPLSNFIQGFDKYSRKYTKKNIKNSSYPDRFYVLEKDELLVGFEKTTGVIAKIGLAGDKHLLLKTALSAEEVDRQTQLAPGHLGRQINNRNWIQVDSVALMQQNPATGVLEEEEITVEDACALSLSVLSVELHPYATLQPRSISVLPIAIGCQAKCSFCFSHSSISLDQTKQRRLAASTVEQVLQEAQQRGAERAVITGGGEPGLLPLSELLALVRLCDSYFPRKVTLISNGYFLSSLAHEEERQYALQALSEAGLSVLSVSRHGVDEESNTRIMKLATKADVVGHSCRQLALPGPRLRWVCVLQKGGVEDEASLARYLDWVVSTGASEICFKELYVSTSHESLYHSSEYNQWSRQHQVPLALILQMADKHQWPVLDHLPWGAPIFDARWHGHSIKIAAYTEPSVFWERSHGLARSWNLLADGLVYVSLEDRASLLKSSL